MADYVLAIDQGTTSTRAMLFDPELGVAGVSQQEIGQHYPQPGWVEHDPEEIWQTVLATCREAMAKVGAAAADVAGIGITNQRETAIVWERAGGRAIHPAIVWQDRRTAAACAELKAAGHEPEVSERTGLLLDPYFSATKLGWLLDHVPGARERAEQGELAFGTVDSYLIWRLTGGAVHATDATNASRTLLFNIDTGEWDEEMLALFGIPAPLLPEVRDCAADFGQTVPELFGGPISILGVAGDQQAATVGQACFEPGTIKSTYGTGCFAVLNTGRERVRSANRMLSTIAYRLEGVPTYALEGSTFIAGAAVQWLRDGLGLIGSAGESGELAAAADPQQDVYLVPAFVGLGAPHWDPDARGALYGITRGTGPRELARAALEAVCYQTADLLQAMASDWPAAAAGPSVLRVDGGMVASDWTMQRLADLLNVAVERPKVLETTAVGAAYLAGSRAGVYPGMGEFAAQWRAERRYTPRMDPETRERKIAGWRQAVRRTLSRTD